jgi:LacI family transcriptional regulator
MITVKDLARELGLSINTVSRAINNKPDVNPETRRRVLEAAERLGYVANTLARSLVNGRTCTIGLIIADVVNPFYGRVIRGVEETARLNGYSTILVNSNEQDEDEREAVQVLRSKRVDGLLIHPVQQSFEHIARLKQDGIPYVLINRHFDELDGDYVINDNRGGAYQAVQHLVQLGHRRIAHITGSRLVSSVRERIAGYLQALAEVGVEEDPALVVTTRVDMEGGYEAARALLTITPRPTAIFTYSDLVAIGAYKALREAKLVVPRDMSLVGYDDIEVAPFLESPLTTVHQPTYEIGQQGVETLLQRISSRADPEAMPVRRILEPHLVVRRSTGSPAQTAASVNPT